MITRLSSPQIQTATVSLTFMRMQMLSIRQHRLSLTSTQQANSISVTTERFRLQQMLLTQLLQTFPLSTATSTGKSSRSPQITTQHPKSTQKLQEQSLQMLSQQSTGTSRSAIRIRSTSTLRQLQQQLANLKKTMQTLQLLRMLSQQQTLRSQVLTNQHTQIILWQHSKQLMQMQ